MANIIKRLAQAQLTAIDAIAALNALDTERANFIRDMKEWTDYIIKMRAELARCVSLLDGACTLPDGSNADTSKAHALLGDFDKD